MKVRAKRNEIIAAVAIAAVMLTAVSLAAGAQSFGHMYDWARLNDEPHWRALLFPISVDGTILASTVVLYVDHRLDRPGTPLAYWLLGVGVAISVVANVFHTWHEPDIAARGISAIGPLALFGIFHLFVQFIRSLVGVIPPKDVKPVVLEQTDEQAVPVDEGVPVEIAEPFTLRPGRLGAVRSRRRPGRLAGRGRHAKPPQAPAAPVLDPVPAWRLGPDPDPLRVEYSEPIGPRTSAMVLSGPGDSRETVPVLQPVLEPVGASAAESKRPATVTQNTRTGLRSRVARTSRSKAKASPDELQAAARAYWESEKAAGRDPSAGQIAKAIGGAKSSVHRWSQSWTEGAAG